MPRSDFKGTANITDQGIKKHFKNFEPWHALVELVWNGLDARATRIDINVESNDLHGLEVIQVVDNGDGIDFHNLSDNFDRFNESLKKGASQHGSHGRGRLAFHKLCQNASWYTRFGDSDAYISVNSGNVKNYTGENLSGNEQLECLQKLKSGTCVLLENFTENLPEIEVLLHKFSIEFGWYLALNKEREIFFNNGKFKVTIPVHDFKEVNVDIEDSPFKLTFLRWHDKPTSEQSHYYLLNSGGRTVYKQYSSFNKKSLFWLSVYAQSDWVDDFTDKNPDMFVSEDCTTSSKTYKRLLDVLNSHSKEIYEDYLRRFVDDEMEKFKEEGAFPTYVNEDSSYGEWRLGNTLDLVRQIYISEPALFKNSNKKQRKIIIRLLDKITVSDHNEDLFEVLESVLDLEPEKMKKFSEQIQRSKLEHIISTIDVLHRREHAVSIIREIMRNHYNRVLETPDMQLVIENNTWLFGSQYETLGAEEDDFVSITKKMRSEIKGIDDIDADDLDDITYIEGIRGQVDLFLARRIPKTDYDGTRYFHCVVIEIKRPGIALNFKHLNQLDRYASILAKNPEFNGDHTRIDLVLVGRKISSSDTSIKARLDTCKDKQDPGLVTAGKIKSYVKTWESICEEFELSNEFLLSKLETKKTSLADYSASKLLENLQSQKRS